MILATERLVLRDFVEDDWPTVLSYQQNPLYLRYYEWSARSGEDVRDFVQMFLDQQQSVPRRKFQLAATLRSTGQLIGNCGIRVNSFDAFEADIGYELDPHYWGHGYAIEAARAIVEFGFAELRLHRIWAETKTDNIGSVRLLAKLGLRQEGRLREKEYFKGRWWDTLIYAILEREWEEQRKRG
jgi:RimJ/RimL family protein N-acetyltransferase